MGIHSRSISYAHLAASRLKQTECDFGLRRVFRPHNARKSVAQFRSGPSVDLLVQFEDHAGFGAESFGLNSSGTQSGDANKIHAAWHK